MNGQMFQIASIVAAGKKAMQLSEPIKYSPLKYEGSIEFAFLPQQNFSEKEKYVAPNVSAWFEQIKKIGVQDIKLFCPYSVRDRQVLAFSNTTASSIMCFHENGKVTCFVPYWTFNSKRKFWKFNSKRNNWNILYSEYDWIGPSTEKPHFENNTDSFRDVLLSVKELAIKIGCDEYFPQVFDSAINLLDGSSEYPDKQYGLELPPIPRQNLQMFETASVADVFGGMGSWNDDPVGMAHDKGLDEEYEKLSDELLKNVRLAILYAINEW